MQFFVNNNPQANGDHEVHSSTCIFLPSKANRTLLGEFFTCSTAVDKALEHFDKVNGCYFCSRLCHEKE